MWGSPPIYTQTHAVTPGPQLCLYTLSHVWTHALTCTAWGARPCRLDTRQEPGASRASSCTDVLSHLNWIQAGGRVEGLTSALTAALCLPPAHPSGRQRVPGNHNSSSTTTHFYGASFLAGPVLSPAWALTPLLLTREPRGQSPHSAGEENPGAWCSHLPVGLRPGRCRA